MLWSAKEVKFHFKDKITYILNAPPGKQKKTSEIRDILTDQQIRN